MLNRKIMIVNETCLIELLFSVNSKSIIFCAYGKYIVRLLHRFPLTLLTDKNNLTQLNSTLIKLKGALLQEGLKHFFLMN